MGLRTSSIGLEARASRTYPKTIRFEQQRQSQSIRALEWALVSSFVVDMPMLNARQMIARRASNP